MPSFRFTGEPRVTLRFRNGICELWLANLGGGEWGWVAEKPGQPNARIVLAKNSHMPTLHQTLTVTGFSVAVDSAAERVMRAAVKCGHAEELPLH